jgi:hypothetical protein
VRVRNNGRGCGKKGRREGEGGLVRKERDEQKVQRHEAYELKSPPMNGPMADPSAIAIPSRLGAEKGQEWKTWKRKESSDAPLVLSAVSYSDDIADDDHRKRVDSSSSNTSNTSTGVEPDPALCKPAEQIPEDEEEQGAEENRLASEDVAQAGGDDLEGGVGEEEGGSDPGN